MSPRNGGNGIPSIIHRATGVDLEVATLKLAMGELVTFPTQINSRQGAASFVFGSYDAGILRNIATQEQVKQQIPEVFALQLAITPGERVSPLEHNGNMIGYTLFDCPNPQDYDRITQEMMQALQIKVDPMEIGE
jgi:hypothetical protein